MVSIGDEGREHLNDLEQIADEHYRTKEYTNALKDYDEALRSNPNKASLHVGRGNCLRKQERYNEALNAYEKATVCNQQCAEAYNGKGLVLRFQKKWGESLIVFDRAINLGGRRQPSGLSIFI